VAISMSANAIVRCGDCHATLAMTTVRVFQHTLTGASSENLVRMVFENEDWTTYRHCMYHTPRTIPTDGSKAQVPDSWDANTAGREDQQ